MVADNSFNIQEFSLENVTLTPAPVRYIEAVVSNDEQLNNQNNFTTQKNDESFYSVEKYSNIQYPFARTTVQCTPIKSAQILCSSKLKKFIQLTFDVSNLPCEYLPGDTISILPQNSNDDVNIILQSLHLMTKSDHKCVLSILAGTTKKGAKIPAYLPVQTTPRELLKNLLNILSTPKKLFLRSLADYTTNEDEKKFLQTLCSKEGNQFYNKLITEKSFTFLDILKCCSSCQPPLGVLIEHLPRLLPRPYSIVNSPLTTTNEIKILFSVLNDNPGLTTNLLEDLANKFIENPRKQLNVNLYHRIPNQFRFTEEEFSKNIIMISVGCAIAPFIGFLEHKTELSKLLNNPGISWLFTGFQNQENFLYKNELDEFKKLGILSECFQSFSQDSDAKWKYIQNSIMANREQFVELLMNENTILFVCADGAEISKSIQSTIRESLENVLNCNCNDADEIIKNLKKNLKYREDVWL